MIIDSNSVKPTNFVVFEGINGSGKTSVINNLKVLLGNDVVFTKEPGGTNFGTQIREILLNPKNEINPMSELFLILADRAEHLNYLKSIDAPVISDRYFYSTIAFQGAGRGLGVEFVEALCEKLVGDLLPGVVVLFDCPPQVGLSRKNSRDRIELCDLDFHSKVRKCYLEMAERRKEAFIILDTVKLTLSEVLSLTLKIVKKAFSLE